MDDQRLGGVFRSVRIQRRWRQVDLADAAGVGQATVSRLERGDVGELSISTVREIAAALEVRVDLVARWRGGDLDRLMGANHSAMHEAIARLLVRTPGWVSAPEVSSSVYGERGVIDVLAWHAERRMLLVIELKTELIDVQSLVGQVDRYRRLAGRIGRARGWDAAAVSSWVVLADSRANRRRLARHVTVLRGASRWMADRWPAGSGDPIGRSRRSPSCPMTTRGTQGAASRRRSGSGGRRRRAAERGRASPGECGAGGPGPGVSRASLTSRGRSLGRMPGRLGVGAGRGGWALGPGTGAAPAPPGGDRRPTSSRGRHPPRAPGP